MAYTYDPTTGLYRDGTRTVPDASIRQALDAVIADSGARLRILAARWQDGTLDTLGFREAVRTELRTAYGVGASLAHGGTAAMDASARGWLSGQLRTAYGYLDQLALQRHAGAVSDAQLAARAAMYASGVWQTYEAGRARTAPQRGETEERSVLDGGAHCDGCLAAAAQGWQPVGTLPLPGARDCVSRCRCRIERRAAAAVEA